MAHSPSLSLLYTHTTILLFCLCDSLVQSVVCFPVRAAVFHTAVHDVWLPNRSKWYIESAYLPLTTHVLSVNKVVSLMGPPWNKSTSFLHENMQRNYQIRKLFQCSQPVLHSKHCILVNVISYPHLHANIHSHSAMSADNVLWCESLSHRQDCLGGQKIYTCTIYGYNRAIRREDFDAI